MNLEILTVGHPTLRTPIIDVGPSRLPSADIDDAIANMFETMRHAQGIGLAASQVGILLRIAVIEDRTDLMSHLSAAQIAERERVPVGPTAFINPRLVFNDSSSTLFFETCLSCGPIIGLVQRHRSATVQYVDRHGETCSMNLSGWPARIVQHEVDHLDGIVCVERMLPRSIMLIEEFNRHWKGASIAAFCAANAIGI